MKIIIQQPKPHVPTIVIGGGRPHAAYTGLTSNIHTAIGKVDGAVTQNIYFGGSQSAAVNDVNKVFAQISSLLQQLLNTLSVVFKDQGAKVGGSTGAPKVGTSVPHVQTQAPIHQPTGQPVHTGSAAGLQDIRQILTQIVSLLENVLSLLAKGDFGGSSAKDAVSITQNVVHQTSEFASLDY